MQYVDLGKLPRPDTEKKNKRKKLLKFSVVVLLSSLVLYTGYVLYWPTVALLKQIAKQPRAVLSLIQNPQGELKSTDGRTNFLLVGIDKRANVPYSYEGPNGQTKKNGFLTDSIMVVSVNQDNKKVSMISIPRDTWVRVPNFGKVKNVQSKINSVYSLGEANDYPSGGMALLEKQVEEITGLPVHYATRIDFEGFKKGINTLGGVDVVIDKTFDDYQYPADGKENATCKDGTYNCRFEHLHFTAGPAHLNGEKALKFVRSRKGTNGEGSDFARAARQQKVIAAAKEKALKIENLFDPVKLNNLFQDFGQTIETDLDISALVALYNLSKEADFNDINSLVLDNSTDNYLYSPPEGQYGGYVLLPKGNSWSAIRKAVKELVDSDSTASSAQ